MSKESIKIKFNQLAVMFLDEYAGTRLKPVTVYNYEKQINKYLLIRFGEVSIEKISASDIDSWLRELAEPSLGEGNLSTTSAKRLYYILSGILSFAAQKGFLEYNPCGCFSIKATDMVQKNGRMYLIDEEINEFLSLFNDDEDVSVIVKLLIFTGMRTGEGLGLEWKDVDFDNHMIFIRHTLTDVGGRHFLTAPKTKNSNRHLFMGEQLTKLLALHKERQMKRATRENLRHPEMVFTSRTGEYKDRGSLRTGFISRIKEALLWMLTTWTGTIIAGSIVDMYRAAFLANAHSVAEFACFTAHDHMGCAAFVFR